MNKDHRQSDLRIENARKATISGREELIAETMEILLGVARKHARSREQERDFVQDGVVCALEMYDRYGHKPKAELIRMTGKAIYRRICSKQRSSITYERNHILKSPDLSIDGTEDDEFNFETSNFVKVLRGKLSAVERRVLQERINPGPKVVGIMLIEKAVKVERKKAGFLVMNVDKEEITNAHIAKGIEVSPATVSRSVKRIQEEARFLLDGPIPVTRSLKNEESKR